MWHSHGRAIWTSTHWWSQDELYFFQYPVTLCTILMAVLRNWNVLCWNIHSLNGDDKQLALHNANNNRGRAIIYLQETKKQYFDLPFVKSCFPRCFDQFAYISSGGIITIWNSSLYWGCCAFWTFFINCFFYFHHLCPFFFALVNIMDRAMVLIKWLSLIGSSIWTSPPMSIGSWLETSNSLPWSC